MIAGGQRVVYQGAEVFVINVHVALHLIKEANQQSVPPLIGWLCGTQGRLAWGRRPGPRPWVDGPRRVYGRRQLVPRSRDKAARAASTGADGPDRVHG